MTDIWKDAAPEVRDAAKALLPSAVKILRDYLQDGSLPIIADADSDGLDAAIARAERLDDGLAKKLGDKESARIFLKKAFDTALTIAVKLAIAAA